MIGGLYSSGMHDFVLREAEVGTRVAMAEDDEACGMGPFWDEHYRQFMRSQPWLPDYVREMAAEHHW